MAKKAEYANVIDGMLSIHAVITRGLEVAIEKSGALARQTGSDTATREGFVHYVRCLVSLLSVHHDTEDTLAFPRFREMVSAPYDLLSEQHRMLHPLLEEARAAVEEAARTPDATEPWDRLNLALNGIREIWQPHIKIEEEHFTVDGFAKALAPEEHAAMSALFMRHTQEHTGPDYLMVPFLLYNLPSEKLAFFAAEMPPVVIQELVPAAWKEKWAPMQPYLLA